MCFCCLPQFCLLNRALLQTFWIDKIIACGLFIWICRSDPWLCLLKKFPQKLYIHSSLSSFSQILYAHFSLYEPTNIPWERQSKIAKMAVCGFRLCTGQSWKYKLYCRIFQITLLQISKFGRQFCWFLVWFCLTPVFKAMERTRPSRAGWNWQINQ